MFESLGILWGNLLWQMAAFLLLVFLLTRFAYRPIIKMLDDRANRIRESMEQAEQIRLDNQNAAKRAQEILAQAQAETREILAQANQMSQRTISAAQEEARQQREKILEDARTQIQTETQRAKEELRREVGRLAIMAASRVIGKSLDDQDHYRLVDEALSDVEQTRGFGRG
ncbi:MAG: F-type H+-transporting ATPase subunit b [Chloroflexia bacterium]|jgi:F-type H+-transporting ATPase subunit b|nr:F-type H+-transporting ATPase subunit b [Chloroflexia bacterium]